MGGFSLRGSDDRPIELKARKSRQLLAYLAVPSGQVRTREQLASLLWSDRQEEQARASLRTALSGIRRAIGNDALIVEHDTVRLRSGYLETDFDQLKMVSTNASKITKLSDFYSGQFLAGQEHDSELYMDWLRGLRSECLGLALVVLGKNADRLASEGSNRSAIDLMRESLLLEPLKEQTHRTIMKLYAANGEKAMALAQFRTCKEVLLHELDASPDPETQALADSIALKDVSVFKELRHKATLGPESFVTHASNTPSTDTNMPSIAVLPFVNMSGDAEQNYFADGITEDIIVDLSDIDALSVVAKSSSEMYRGCCTSLRISEELGVRYILEGSIRKSGENIRVSALLNDPKTSRQIWAKRYDRKLENIFDVQSEISQEIVKALELNLTSNGKHITDKRTTSSAEAYQYYLQGRTLLRVMSERSIILARGLFERAVKLDPNYALAYTGLADCATTLFCHYDVDPSFYDIALAASNRALQINPTLAEAYASRGYILQYGSDINVSIENFEKAISLNPKLADTYFYLGGVQVGIIGEIEKAYISFNKAFTLDQDIRSGMMLLTCLAALDYPNELKSFSNKILRLAQRRISLNAHDFGATQVVAICLHTLEKPDEARYWANVASSFDTQDARSIYNLACLQSQLGAVDECLALLGCTLELGCSKRKLDFLKTFDPDLETVRKDPRFYDLIARYE